MQDALLFAVRDGIRKAGFGYDSAVLCELSDDGKPPPRIGNLFVAVSPLGVTSTSVRNLDELYGFAITLTMRVSVPLDRVGDQLLASKLARVQGPSNPSFNARLDQLRAWGHMNWVVGVQNANANLIAWAPPNAENVYGFVTPAQYRNEERPLLVGPDWLSLEPESKQTALKATMNFDGSRRMQAQTQPVGPYV